MKHEEISFHTKKALAEALKDAMKSKPFHKITVSELIQQCNVNRKTFYYHFEDIYALLKWMLEQEAIEVVKNFDLFVDYEDAIVFIMDYIEENDYIINCAYDSIGRDGLKLFFCADFLEITVSIIEQAENFTGKKMAPTYKDFLSHFYMEAIAGMLIDWIKDRSLRNKNDIINYIANTIRYSLIGILQSLPDDNGFTET